MHGLVLLQPEFVFTVIFVMKPINIIGVYNKKITLILCRANQWYYNRMQANQ